MIIAQRDALSKLTKELILQLAKARHVQIASLKVRTCVYAYVCMYVCMYGSLTLQLAKARYGENSIFQGMYACFYTYICMYVAFILHLDKRSTRNLHL
jgi:hypothetical protein